LLRPVLINLFRDD